MSFTLSHADWLIDINCTRQIWSGISQKFESMQSLPQGCVGSWPHHSGQFSILRVVSYALQVVRSSVILLFLPLRQDTPTAIPVQISRFSFCQGVQCRRSTFILGNGQVANSFMLYNLISYLWSPITLTSPYNAILHIWYFFCKWRTWSPF